MAARIAARSVARPASQISRAAEDSFRVSSQRALMLAHLHRDNAEAAGLEGFARKLALMESAPPDATPLRHRQHALGVIATFLKGLGEHSAAKSYAIESVQLVPTPQVSPVCTWPTCACTCVCTCVCKRREDRCACGVALATSCEGSGLHG